MAYNSLKSLLKVLCAFVFCTFGAIAIAQTAGPLEGQVYGNGSKTLVVVLHGDVSRGGPANYHYGFAKKLAGQNSSATVVALLRPGYSDGRGRTSTGSNNNRRDHYTSKNNNLVAETIKNMQAQIGATRVVAVGHSGGAAQIGAILGRFPGLIDSAVLVSCPCDITRWRKMRGRSAWTKSQSPSRYVKKIKGQSRVIAITGKNDDNTSVVLAQSFVDAATKSGTQAKLIEVSGAGHNFGGALSRAALNAANSEIRR